MLTIQDPAPAQPACLVGIAVDVAGHGLGVIVVQTETEIVARIDATGAVVCVAIADILPK